MGDKWTIRQRGEKQEQAGNAEKIVFELAVFQKYLHDKAHTMYHSAGNIEDKVESNVIKVMAEVNHDIAGALADILSGKRFEEIFEEGVDDDGDE